MRDVRAFGPALAEAQKPDGRPKGPSGRDMTIRMTPRKLLKAALKLFKTMAFGYAGAAYTDAAALAAEGARVFADMAELPALIGAVPSR